MSLLGKKIDLGEERRLGYIKFYFLHRIPLLWAESCPLKFIR
jgi:hypothetical protein